MRMLAIGLGIWGAALFLTGAWLAIQSGIYRGNALGQGSPVLMLFGGGMTAAVAAAIGSIARREHDRPIDPMPWLKGAQVLAFLAAVGILVVGIARHDPRRDPLIVGLTAIALSISVTARWWEHRIKGVPAG